MAQAHSNDETEVACGWQDKVDPKTGRSTKCDTSTPWWKKIIHLAADGIATYYGGDSARKMVDAGFDAVQKVTDKMDGHDLKKWFNDSPSAPVVVWGVAHAQGFVTDAWAKTDHDWPMRKAALLALGVTPDTFAGGPDQQASAAFKVMLFSFIFGGIGWCYARHVLEALMLEMNTDIVPLLKILEDRKQKRPKEKAQLAVTAPAWTLETIALIKAAAASLPPSASVAKPLPAVPPAVPTPVAAGAAGIGDPVFSLKHDRWGRVEAVGPCPEGRCFGLRFDDGTAGAALESEIAK